MLEAPDRGPSQLRMILACSLPGRAGGGGQLPDRLGDLGGAAVQDARSCAVTQASIAGSRAGKHQAASTGFQHVDEIDQDDQVDAAAAAWARTSRSGGCRRRSGDPGALMARVAAPGLVEDGADRPARSAAMSTATSGAAPARLLAAAGGHDLLRGTAHGRRRTRTELGDPLVALLPVPRRFSKFRTRWPGPWRRAAQRPGQHRHALQSAEISNGPRRPGPCPPWPWSRARAG